MPQATGVTGAGTKRVNSQFTCCHWPTQQILEPPPNANMNSSAPEYWKFTRAIPPPLKAISYQFTLSGSFPQLLDVLLWSEGKKTPTTTWAACKSAVQQRDLDWLRLGKKKKRKKRLFITMPRREYFPSNVTFPCQPVPEAPEWACFY